MIKRPGITLLPMTTEPDQLNTESAIEVHTIASVLMPAGDMTDLVLITDMVLMLTDPKVMTIPLMDVMDEVMNKAFTLPQLLLVPITLHQQSLIILLQFMQPLFIMLPLKLPQYNMLL